MSREMTLVCMFTSDMPVDSWTRGSSVGATRTGERLLSGVNSEMYTYGSNVYCEFYQLPQSAIQMAIALKLLLAMEQGTTAKNAGKSMENTHVTINDELQYILPVNTLYYLGEKQAIYVARILRVLVYCVYIYEG